MRPRLLSKVAIFAMSSWVNSKPNTSKFSTMRAGVTDFGIATRPLWMCQRSATWAGVRP